MSRLVWATRGHSWGFRFLLDAGMDDPLPEYERAFGDVGDGRSVTSSYDGGLAVRFMDPLGRRDAAGREIPHEFVVLGGLGSPVLAANEPQSILWSVVSDAYSRIWDTPSAPTRAELGLSADGQ